MIIRRKLILILGPLIGLLLVAALSSIVVLRNLLGDLEHITDDALTGATTVSNLSANITEIEAELAALRLKENIHLDRLIESVDNLQTEIRKIGGFYIMKHEGADGYQKIRNLLPVFVHQVADLATKDPGIAEARARQALNTSVELRREIIALSEVSMQHTRKEQQKTTAMFRRLVLGLGLVFLVVLNVSIIVLLRAASVVLGPVEQLVEASRHLANEEFGFRLKMSQKDEFDELARAFNEMAEQLQRLDERRIETLHQVARTLSHNLNNAIEVIDLQLRFIARPSNGDQSRLAKPLQHIHASLLRMSNTVDSLTRVKRIVLTDYLEGVKMLDLERSVEPSEEPSPFPKVHVADSEESTIARRAPME